MIVYKVVRKNRKGEFFSCVIKRQSIAVRYEIGKKSQVRIEGSPMMVFEKYDDAVRFIWMVGTRNRCILSCESSDAVHSNQKTEFILDAGLINRCIVSLYSMRNFWKDYKSSGKHAMCIPNGTMFCRDLTPLEVVFDENPRLMQL